MSNEMKDWISDTIKENKELCMLYPFLDCDHTYESTWLDFVPIGWQESFLRMCQKLYPFKKDFEIFEIKEKYGQLRVYIWTDDEIDVDRKIYDQVQEVIDSFCEEAAHICIKCGGTLEVKDCLCKTCRK